MKKTLLAGALILSMAAALSGCGSSAGSTGAGTSGAAASEAAGETKGKPANRLEDILQRGYIEVATEPYFAPNEFIDSSKTGDEQYVGSDIELAKYIADKLGVELRIVPLEFSAVLSSVTEGKYDLAISALAYTPEREEAMNLSHGYRFNKEPMYGILVREEDKDKYEDVESMEDAVVVVQSGSLQEYFVTTQIPKCKELKRVSSTTDGFLMVQEGKADIAATALTTANLYAEANPGVTTGTTFRFKEDAEHSGTRIGIKKGEDELTEKVNECVDELVESGRYQEWYEEYGEYAKKLGIK